MQMLSPSDLIFPLTCVQQRLLLRNRANPMYTGPDIWGWTEARKTAGTLIEPSKLSWGGGGVVTTKDSSLFPGSYAADPVPTAELGCRHLHHEQVADAARASSGCRRTKESCCSANSYRQSLLFPDTQTLSGTVGSHLAPPVLQPTQA